LKSYASICAEELSITTKNGFQGNPPDRHLISGLPRDEVEEVTNRRYPVVTLLAFSRTVFIAVTLVTLGDVIV
jgi:hypothetical protein